MDLSYVRGLYDLTKYFITQEEYELLPENDRWGKDDNADGPKQAKVLPYQIGSREIALGGTYSGRFDWTHLKLAEIIQKAGDELETELHKQYCCDDQSHTGECLFADPQMVPLALAEEKADAHWYDVAFHVEYYPLLDTVASIQKADETNLSLMAVMDSQTEQTLDISRHGKKLAGLLKRIGNDSYVVDVKAQKYSSLLSLLSRIDVDGEKYILYKREYAVYNDFVNCRYYFSQNYTAVQENAGVNRERQIFPIPTEYNETPILIKQKLEFSLVRYGVKEDMVADEGINKAFSLAIPTSAMQTLIGKNSITIEEDSTEVSTKGKLNYLLFQSIHPEYTGMSPSSGNWYLLPFASYVLDNTMNFIASPLDNYSVAYSRTAYTWSFWGTGGRKTIYNPYVDSSEVTQLGEVASFYLRYGFDFPDYPTTLLLQHKNNTVKETFGVTVDGVPTSWYEWDKNTNETENVGGRVLHNLKSPIPSTYPVVYKDTLISAMSTNENDEKSYFAVDYKKDRMQKPAFVLSLSATVAKKDKGKLFIDPIFVKMNNLVRDNDDGVDMHFWIKDTPFVEGDEFVDTKYIAQKNDGSRFEAGDYFEIVDKSSYVILEPCDEDYEQTFGTYQSWGICDASGRVYLAVNGEVCPIVLVCRD